MTPKDFDGRRRRYVPMDVHLAFGTFGSRLLDKWGMEGLCTWVLFLAACKREPNEGTFTYTTDDEAWGKLGAKPVDNGSGLSLDAFWTFTGQQKKTSRRRHGRVTYIVCTRWEAWNTPRGQSYTQDGTPQNPSKQAQNTEQIPQKSNRDTKKYGENARPEVEVEVEVESEDEGLTATAQEFHQQVRHLIHSSLLEAP